MAMDVMLDRHQSDIERKHKLYNWQEGDEHFAPAEGEDWFKLITLPALASKGKYGKVYKEEGRVMNRLIGLVNFLLAI